MVNQSAEEFIYNDIRRKLHDNAKKEYNQEMLDFIKSKDWQHCEYCKAKILSKYETKYPWKEVSSIDHKIPRIFPEGSNDYSNIAIVCCRCNIAKGTMRSENYLILLQALSSFAGEEKKEEILNELFIGRKAAKLKQLEGDAQC
jgi:5-methylcytosine-specific restriction endonuclease McrA